MDVLVGRGLPDPLESEEVGWKENNLNERRHNFKSISFPDSLSMLCFVFSFVCGTFGGLFWLFIFIILTKLDSSLVSTAFL